jgi:hypothetical protein
VWIAHAKAENRADFVVIEKSLIGTALVSGAGGKSSARRRDNGGSGRLTGCALGASPVKIAWRTFAPYSQKAKRHKARGLNRETNAAV